MMTPRRMKRVLIAGSKDRLPAIVDVLQASRLVHIEVYSAEDEEGVRTGDPMEGVGKASERLTKVRSSAAQLDIPAARPLPPSERKEHEKAVKDIDALITRIDGDISKTIKRRAKLEEQLRQKTKQRDHLRPFVELGVDTGLLQGYVNLRVFIGTARADFTPGLDTLKRPYELFGTPGDPDRLFALFTSLKDAPEFQRLIEENGYSEVRPSEEPEPEKVCIGLDKEITSDTNELDALDKRLASLRDEMSEALHEGIEVLELDVERAEAPMHFATTANAFLITGWVPANMTDKLENQLLKVAHRSVYVEFEDPVKGDDVPVAIENPASSRPFNVLTGLMGTPSYKEVDPTVLMSIGMPVFFGFMLGDIGYGITLLILIATGLFGRLLDFFGMSGSKPQLLKVLTVCGISTIVFGFLYNEFFGFELMMYSAAAHHNGESGAIILFEGIDYPEFSVLVPLWGKVFFPVTRIEEAMTLLVVTILIGVCHLLLGLAIGIRNHWVVHGFKQAILEKGSWFLILFGGTLFLGYYMITMDGEPVFDMYSIYMMLGIPLFVTGIVLLIVGEGIIGLMHIFSLLSNTLSYARLLAIGISSVAIAMVFNGLALDSFEAGGAGGYMGGALMLFMGHSLNLLLGILGPTLHGLRLHLVEFFIKFYDGTGRPFEPFGRHRWFTTRGGGR